jgi:hypothetical protein
MRNHQGSCAVAKVGIHYPHRPLVGNIQIVAHGAARWSLETILASKKRCGSLEYEETL